MFTSIFTGLITCIAISCYRSVARSVPLNYIVLFIFTISEAYIVGYACAASNPNTVLMAAVTTFGNINV